MSPSATGSMLAATPLALSVSSLIAQMVSSWLGTHITALPCNHGREQCEVVTLAPVAGCAA